MLGGRPLQQMEADHGMLCGRLILRTHKQQNPSRRSEGFSFVGPDTAKSTDAFWCDVAPIFAARTWRTETGLAGWAFRIRTANPSARYLIGIP